MAQQTVRFKVGAVTSCLAAAALLAGPALTWGLDVPLTSGGATTQVTTTVQNTVTSTQQTVNSAVTNVQSTVQTTVEQAPTAVQQVAASPAPAAPAAAPAAAPVTRTVAAVQKKSASAPKPVRSSGGHSAVIRAAAPALTTPAGRAAVSKSAQRVQRPAKSTRRATSASPAKPAPAESTSSSCGGLGLTDLLPAELDLGGLLSLACTALDALAPNQASSATGVLPSLSLQELLGVTASSASKLRARVGAPLLLPQSSDQQRVAGSFSEPKQPGVPSVYGAGLVERGAVAAWTSTPTLPAVAAADAASAQRSGHGHQGIFSKRVDGTKALAWILMVDGLILGLLLVWRAARRWVVPRFA